MRRYDVEPSRLVVEVTETAVLSLLDSVRDKLVALRGLGIGLHVDDFGTGYSSIALLRDLPVTGLKLRPILRHALTIEDSQANALSSGLAALCRSLHLEGVAEGVETDVQAAILRAHGWSHGQGYLFGRPEPDPLPRLTGSRGRPPRDQPVVSRTLPTCSPASTTRCASAASRIGSTRSTTGTIAPDSTSGHASVTTAAQMADFSATGRARRVVAETVGSRGHHPTEVELGPGAALHPDHDEATAGGEDVDLRAR